MLSVWYNDYIWPRFGSSLGQLCLHQITMIIQGLNLFHLTSLLQTCRHVWIRLNSFQVCHRFIPDLFIFLLGIYLELIHYYFVPSLSQTVTDWYNFDICSRCGASLGQSCFHRIIMFDQGLDFCHLTHLGQTGGRVRDKLNSFQVCHRFVPYLSFFHVYHKRFCNFSKESNTYM